MARAPKRPPSTGAPSARLKTNASVSARKRSIRLQISQYVRQKSANSSLRGSNLGRIEKSARIPKPTAGRMKAPGQRGSPSPGPPAASPCTGISAGRKGNAATAPPTMIATRMRPAWGVLIGSVLTDPSRSAPAMIASRTRRDRGRGVRGTIPRGGRRLPAPEVRDHPDHAGHDQDDAERADERGPRRHVPVEGRDESDQDRGRAREPRQQERRTETLREE